MFDLRNGRQEAISIDAADRVLTKLGLNDWFRIPKDQGGLLELYTEEEVFTPSWAPPRRALLSAVRPGRRKYLTEEARLEAKARRNHKFARRLGKTCECGTVIRDTSTMCKPCYMASRPTPAHGTHSRYNNANYKCRCPECRAAAAAYELEKRSRWRKAA